MEDGLKIGKISANVDLDAAATIFQRALWVEAGFASDCMKRNTRCE
jgi:hypothetical protein